MPYDPHNPVSIFDPNSLQDFLSGLSNASALRMGLGGDLNRPDVGVCMVALSAAEAMTKEDCDA